MSFHHDAFWILYTGSIYFSWLILPPAGIKQFKVSHSLGFFVVKVEMSCSRAGLSNPALYAFQPHAPYLLLTASNWNCDHIFHTIPRSLLELSSLTQWSEFFFPPLVSLSVSPSWYLSFPPSLCSPGFVAAFRDSSIAHPDIVFVFCESSRLSLSVYRTVHLLRLKRKKRQSGLEIGLGEQRRGRGGLIKASVFLWVTATDSSVITVW